MLPLCEDQKIGVIPWSPLARGLLTGGRSKERNETERAKTDAFGKSLYGRDDDFAVADRVTEIAKEHGPAECPNCAGLDAEQAPLSRRPSWGPASPATSKDAVAAVGVKLSADEIKRLEEPYQPHPVLGFS